MNGLLQDVRYAARQLRKRPGFAATAIIVLALGIGATTGMLAIVQSVLVRPLNYRDADRVVLVGLSDEANSTSKISYVDFREMQRSLHQFEQLGAYSSMPVPVQTPDGAQMLVAPAVSTNFFNLLGVYPMMGRSFRDGDDAPGAGTAVISHEFWQHSMHASRDVLGSKLKVNGDLYTVIGVMPPHFQFPVQTETLWTTLQVTPEQKTRQGFDTFSVLGRIQPGDTLQQARSEGEAFFRNRPSGSGSVRTSHFWVYPYKSLVTGNQKPALLALLAACVLLLLIAVVNTANLQIARATRRETEIAMRAALGASRGRLLRQLVVESLLLSAAGAALGWLLAIGFVSEARHLFGGFARFDELRLDSWTFVGCLLLTSASGIAAALAPAWHLLGKGRNLSVQHNTAGHVSRPQRLSSTLVTAEVALTCILLTAAGLFLRTFRALQNVPLGFTPDHVTSFLLWPQGGETPLTAERSDFQRLLDRLEHLPGVEAAGMITSLPVSNFQIGISGSFSIPGHLPRGQKDAPQVGMLAVSPGYFRAMRIPLLAGHSLSENDTLGQVFGVVNHAFVEEYLRGVNPVGQQIVLDKDAEFPQPITIIGVSGDVMQGNAIGGPIQPEVAVSYQQLPASSMLTHFLIGIAASFAVRSKADSHGLSRDIRSIVKSETPEFAIDNLVSMDSAVRNTLSTRRLSVEITSAFAWLALLLSAAGLYGVLAYLVGQRIREIGIRLALGATREDVFALICRQGLWMVGSGLALGWIGALFASRWIRSFLFGTTAYDPVTYTLVGVLIVVASATAMSLPARRAASIEPMDALRTE